MPELIERVILWFVPAQVRNGRTEAELARIFVFTHLFGPLIAQPMAIYLYFIASSQSYPLVVMVTAICSFWLLPFVLRLTADFELSTFLSFQLLTAASLFGTYHYGGFSSPFLPWLTVALLLGLFYLAKRQALVVGVFTSNIAVFLFFVVWYGIPSEAAVSDLAMLGWLSIGAASVYMAWMALYYSRTMALRNELEAEAENYRSIASQLERAQAVAEETGRARARFFSKMSHELRTPLNAIIGYSDILLEDCEADPNASKARMLDISRINAAGKHLLSLVSDVLDADSFENDVLRINPSHFTLSALCEEVVANALPLIEQKGNRFSFSCSPRDAQVHTDRTKLRQILINLLSNAGKFTTKGSVKLELTVSEKGERRMVAVVTDTGIGIGPDVLPRLFADYEQADASVSRDYGGTGLGLALTRKQAILLGGEIRVASRLGQGSSFTLDLPADIQGSLEGDAMAPPRGAQRNAATPGAIAA